MTNKFMNKNILKSIGAVVAGFITVVILSIGTDTVLEKLGIFPPINAAPFTTSLLVIAFLYRSAYTVLGGYVTAALAPERPMKLVWILAGLGTVGGALGIVVGWNLSDHWYPIAIFLSAIPCTWLGGKLKIK